MKLTTSDNKDKRKQISRSLKTLALRIYHSRAFIPLVLFLLVTLTMAFLRTRFAITVTDTEFMGVPPLDALGDLLVWFRERAGPFYRPIEYLLMSAELQAFGKNYTPMIFIQSAILGGVAVLVYFFVIELIREKVESIRVRVFVAAGTAILFCTSFHMIEITWLFLHKSILSEVYILVGLLGYLLYLRTGKNRWLIAVWIPGILGPLTRELPCTLALVILILTIFSRKKDFKLAFTAAVLSFLALFPGFLPSLLLGGELNLDPMVGSGMQRGLLIQNGFFPSLDSLNLDLPFKAALYFSPLAIIAMLLSIAFFYIAKKGRWAHLAGATTLLVLLMTLISIYFPEVPLLSIMALILFTIVICVSSRRYGILLPVLFVAPMLPFVFIPYFDAWLRMPALAFIIMALLWIVELPKGIAALSSSRSWGNLSWLNKLAWLKSGKFSAALIGVLILFAIPNLIMAESTFRNTIEAHQAIANWGSQEMPEGSALVSNLRQTYDIQYYTDDRVIAYYLTYEPPQLAPDGPMPGGRGEPLGQLLQAISSNPQPNVYFMIIETFGRLGFPQLAEDEVELVGEFQAESEYIVFDPFYLLLPEKYQKFPAPTDLKFQSDLSVGPFKETWLTKFDLYQYVGDYENLRHSFDLLQANSGHMPRFWGEYKGFTITADGNTLYALPHWEEYDSERIGPYSLEPYIVVYMGNTMEEVKRAINNASYTQGPELLIDDYRGFMIIGAYATFYGFPKPAGTFEGAQAAFDHIEAGDYHLVYTGESIGEVTDAIDSNPYVGQFAEDLIFVEGGYKGFNILASQGSLYAILMSDGKFDYNRLRNGPYTAVLHALTLEEIKESIDDYMGQPIASIPSSLGSVDHKGFMVISLEGTAYGFPKPATPLETQEAYLKPIESGEYYPVYSGESIEEVTDAIDSDPYIGQFAEDLIFVEGGYKGFNILANQGSLYAILMADGKFDYNRLINGPYTAVLHAQTLEGIKEAIDDYVSPLAVSPTLLIEDYRGFMVISLEGTVYGFPKPDDPLETLEAYLKPIEAGEYYPVYTGETRLEVLLAIDSNPYTGESAEDLISVEVGYKGFNILANKGSFYAILQADGEFDYNRLMNGPYTAVLHAQTLEGIKKAIDDYVSPQVVSPTLLIEDYRGFMVIGAYETFYGFPKSAGPFEGAQAAFDHIEAGEYYPVYSGESIEEVTDAIDSDPYIGQFAEDLIFVEGGYKGFNILASQGSLYAILMSDGKFDYNRLMNGPYTAVLHARTLEEIKEAIDDYVGQ